MMVTSLEWSFIVSLAIELWQLKGTFGNEKCGFIRGMGSREGYIKIQSQPHERVGH